MKLFAKRLLFLIANGVSEEDLSFLRRSFERESAEVFMTTAQPYLVIETTNKNGRGKDVLIDFPIELADPFLFDALILPKGTTSVEAICTDPLALGAIHQFYKAQKPVIVPAEAAHILEGQSLYPGQIVVRVRSEEDDFLGEVIEAISTYTSTSNTKVLVS